MTTKEITNLEISEVSLVDDPANPHAFVEIVKVKGAAAKSRAAALDEAIEKMTSFADAYERASQRRLIDYALNQLYDAFAAFRSSVDSILFDGQITDKRAAVAKEFDAYKAKLTEFAPQAAVAKSRAEGMSADPEAVLKAAVSLKEIVMDMEAMSKALADAEAKIESLTKRAGDAEAKLEEVTKAKDEEIAKLKGDVQKATQTDEEVLKGLPAPVRERLQKAEAENKANREAIEKLRADKEEADAIQKAKTLGVGKPEEVGPFLVRVAKGATTDKDVEIVERLLKGAKAQGKTDIAKSVGSAAGDDTGDPEATLEQKTQEILKAKPALTYHQAYAEAVDKNPALYQEISKARRAKHPAAA